MQYRRIAIYLFLFCMASCGESDEKKTSIDKVDYANIASDGFNLAESHPKAIAIADEVMEAMGGRKAWDDTRYLKWNFFGSRRHIWDKRTGELVIEGIRDSFDIRMNIHSNTGTVNLKGTKLTQQDSLQKYLDKGKSMWINDSYWVFMPFKLKDSGVTLKYVDQDTTYNGKIADVLSLTFNEVGDTPENMYYVYVDSETRLISQWDFYDQSKDSLAQFTTPWDEYSTYGKIELSKSRGENYTISELSASDTLSRYFN